MGLEEEVEEDRSCSVCKQEIAERINGSISACYVYKYVSREGPHCVGEDEAAEIAGFLFHIAR